MIVRRHRRRIRHGFRSILLQFIPQQTITKSIPASQALTGCDHLGGRITPGQAQHSLARAIGLLRIRARRHDPLHVIDNGRTDSLAARHHALERTFQKGAVVLGHMLGECGVTGESIPPRMQRHPLSTVENLD